jgi:hypothetical protein
VSITLLFPQTYFGETTMTKTQSILATIIMCLLFAMGLDGEGLLHKAAMAVGGLILGWLVISILEGEA